MLDINRSVSRTPKVFNNKFIASVFNIVSVLILFLHFAYKIKWYFYSQYLGYCYFQSLTYKTRPSHIFLALFDPEYIISPMFPIDFLYYFDHRKAYCRRNDPNKSSYFNNCRYGWFCQQPPQKKPAPAGAGLMHDKCFFHCENGSVL